MTEPPGLPPLPDAGARRAATTEFGANLVVLAGAGTGKTALLVERVLTALGGGIAAIDEIAAITFTEKAAGEMRERVALGLERLRRLAAGTVSCDPRQAADRAFLHLTEERSVPTEAIGARALAALTGLERASVGTIHNLCSELLRAHPVEAGVDPAFAVDAGARFHSLFEEAWETYLTEELGPRAARPELWRQVLERVRAKDLRTAARDLSEFRVPDEALRPSGRGVDPASLFGEEAARLLEASAAVLARSAELTPVNEEYFHCVREALGDFLDGGLETMQERFRREPRKRRRIELGTGPGRSLKTISREEFKAVVHDSKHLVSGLLDVDEALMRAVLEAVAPFAVRVREAYLARGCVSFDALLSLARDLLRDHEDVREAVKGRYRMLLVDEFQDTDPIQYEIVLFLAERAGGAARDAFATDLAPGRLFVVGDPKQSIYRFRGADYSAFRRAVERIVAGGGRTLHLTASFRSEARVLRSINRLFEDRDPGAWVESEVQPPYVAVEVRDPGAPDLGAVEVWTVAVADEGRAVDRREAEGEILAREIRRWVEEERVCRYDEITLLLRAFTRLAVYLRPLRQAGVPFIVDGGREFLKRPEVGHLLSALRAVALPSDPVALLAFLRSPAGGVPDTELAAYAAAGGRFSFHAEIETLDFPGIAAAFGMLRTVAEEARDLPPDAVVRRVLARTDLLALNALAFEGPQRVANLRKLAAAAADLARDGKLSLLEVVDALEDGRLAEIDADSPLADEGGDAVRVMTIHKAKGLENRVVVVADLARERRFGADPVIVKVARTEQGPVAALSLGGKMSAARAFWDRVEERHEAAEDVRILYVAATRAKERLVVLAGPARRGASLWVEALRAWNYDPESPGGDRTVLADGLVLHRRMSPTPIERSMGAAPGDETARAVAAYTRAATALTESSVPHVALPSSLKHELPPSARTGEPFVARGRSVAKAAGSVAHRFIEAWDGAVPPSLDGLDPLVREAALEEGADPGKVAREAREIVESFLGSPLAARFRELRPCGREVPVLLRRGRTTWSGSLDLLYTDPSGRHVVVDFKTDREDDARVLTDRYREQLGIYREAVQRALALRAPPRVELWLLRHGTIVEV